MVPKGAKYASKILSASHNPFKHMGFVIRVVLARFSKVIV